MPSRSWPRRCVLTNVSNSNLVGSSFSYFQYFHWHHIALEPLLRYVLEVGPICIDVVCYGFRFRTYRVVDCILNCSLSFSKSYYKCLHFCVLWILIDECKALVWSFQRYWIADDAIVRRLLIRTVTAMERTSHILDPSVSSWPINVNEIESRLTKLVIRLHRSRHLDIKLTHSIPKINRWEEKIETLFLANWKTLITKTKKSYSCDAPFYWK